MLGRKNLLKTRPQIHVMNLTRNLTLECQIWLSKHVNRLILISAFLSVITKVEGLELAREYKRNLTIESSILTFKTHKTA